MLYLVKMDDKLVNIKKMLRQWDAEYQKNRPKVKFLEQGETVEEIEENKNLHNLRNFFSEVSLS